MLKTQPFLNMPRSLPKYSILHYIDLSMESMCMKLYWISGLDLCTLLWANKYDDQTDNILEIYCMHQFEFFVHRLPGYLIYRIDSKLKLWTPSYGSRPMDQLLWFETPYSLSFNLPIRMRNKYFFWQINFICSNNEFLTS